MKTARIANSLIVLFVAVIACLTSCSNVKILTNEQVLKRGIEFRYFNTNDVKSVEVYERRGDTALAEVCVTSYGATQISRGFIVDNRFIMHGDYWLISPSDKGFNKQGKYQHDHPVGAFQTTHSLDGELADLSWWSSDTAQRNVPRVFISEGRLQNFGSFINGGVLKDGHSYFFHSNGNISEKMFYRKGEPFGEYLRYHENGVLAESGEYGGAYVCYNMDKKGYFHSNGDTVNIEADYSKEFQEYFKQCFQSNDETVYRKPEYRVYLRKGEVKYFDQEGKRIKTITFDDKGEIVSIKE